MIEKIKVLMQEIYRLKTEKKEKEEALAVIKAELEKLDAEIEPLSLALLSEFNLDNQEEFNWEEEKLIAKKFSKENIGYTSETDVLNYLKDKYNGQYIRSKLTEALDKNALKKAIKTDKELAASLESMTVKSVTEYVVVADAESYKLMLEHINEAKS